MNHIKTWLLTNYLGILLTLFVAGLGPFFAQILDFSSVLVTLLVGMCFNPLIDRPNIASAESRNKRTRIQNKRTA